ncbi:MAG: cbb3-type cytochrome c oxidase N-terminal domain-containing protein [Sphingobacteriaceae bacterium]
MSKINKIKAVALTLLLPAIGLCQDESAANSTYFSNALFNTLLGVILLLLIIIVAFSNVIKNVADSDFLDKKLKMDQQNNTSSGRTISTILFVLMSFSLMAQTKPVDDKIGGLDQFTFYFMFTIIFVELLVLGLLIFQFKFLLRSKEEKAAETRRVESPLMQSLTDAVAVEDEASILLDHDYDGIKELDNNLPPWWKYGFYLTIVVAVVYIFHYHVNGSGDLQTAEYEKEMAQAKLEIAEFMKTSANKVDESSVTLLTDAKDITSGKDAFIASCAACHGRVGEGGVGPNLTDAYWIHGGSIQDIFKSIKYGWTEKGMKAWKEDLSPMQIAQVTSFIMTLKGTNPSNAKAAQGDLYVENGAAPADSTATLTDSLNVKLKADSLSKETKK